DGSVRYGQQERPDRQDQDKSRTACTDDGLAQAREDFVAFVQWPGRFRNISFQSAVTGRSCRPPPGPCLDAADYEGNAAQSEIGRCNVYRVDALDGTVEAVITDLVRPNGIAFSL